MKFAHATPAPMLSDALERAYMQATLSSGESLSIMPTIRKIGSTAYKAGAVVLRVIDNHLAALNDARARDVRYTNSQW